MNRAPSNPRVGIGMPVYNGARYLEDTLNTVLKQSFQDFILFISDNASTDQTEDICRQYASQDARIIYQRQPENVGAAANYECCFLALSSPEYFRWQNADDPIEPMLIEKCLNILDTHLDVVLAYGKSHIIDGNGAFSSTYDDNLALMQNKPSERFITCLQNISLQNLMYGLIRREQLARTARMQAFVSADINLIAELTLYGKFFEIPEHLFNCRRHEECSSWDMTDTQKLAQFWQPKKEKLHFQTWRGFYEFYKAVFRAPISLNEKRIISQYLFKRAYWHKKILTSEFHEYFESV